MASAVPTATVTTAPNSPAASAPAQPTFCERLVNITHPKMTVVLIGAGNRGKTYAQYAIENPELCQVVGVAEPREFSRTLVATKCGIAEENVLSDWRQVTARPKFADAAVVAVQDRMHHEPTVALLALGYHVLLEKPMAVSETECREIVAAAKRHQRILAVGHVMRYTPYSQRIKQLLDAGAIGDLVSVQHLEPVGWYHQAHSYVRGNWRREAESSSMLMAKSCHDVDWLRWVVGRRCERVSSFGSLKHFTRANQPPGAAARCLDCPAAIERQCPYSAIKIYRELAATGHTGWPLHVVCESAERVSVAAVDEALRSGPYGRCVYQCDNDVVDNQVVNMAFADGITASFSMVAFTKEVCVRKTRLFGTRGQIEGDGHNIDLFDFNSRSSRRFDSSDAPRPARPSKMTGHEYGDYWLMRGFVAAVALNDPSLVLSGPDETLESHLIVFAAERARLQSTVETVSLKAAHQG